MEGEAPGQNSIHGLRLSLKGRFCFRSWSRFRGEGRKVQDR
jgi:hypothetical protein